MLKRKTGITLVALVITIIILLILAGITISLVIENGIIQRAQEAGRIYENKEKEEQNQLAQVEDYIENARGNNSAFLCDYSEPVILYGDLDWVAYTSDTVIVDDYVVQEDGLLFASLVLSGTGVAGSLTDMLFYVNDAGMAWLQATSQTSKNLSLPVKKGDVIKVKVLAGGSVFTGMDLCRIAIYPFK